MPLAEIEEMINFLILKLQGKSIWKKKTGLKNLEDRVRLKISTALPS
ncbi:MAG: hypothetical protein CM1200mP30_26960 [Pseudomonadota bacterium]|nr:MAG: hypothetical protein CM1200mP30_26960 [Pseudomonadota bacterium]